MENEWILDSFEGFSRGYEFTDSRGRKFVLGGYSIVCGAFNAYPIGKNSIIHMLITVENLKELNKQ